MNNMADNNMADNNMADDYDVDSEHFTALFNRELIRVLTRDRGAAGASIQRPDGLTEDHILNPPAGDERFYPAVPELVQSVRALSGVAEDTSIEFDIDCYSIVIVSPFKEVSV